MMFNIGNSMNNSFNPQQNSTFYQNNNFPNFPMNNEAFIECKYINQNEGSLANNFYEIKTNYIKKVYIMTKTDFENLSHPNYNGFYPNQANYFNLFFSISDLVNSIMHNNNELYFVKEDFFKMRNIPIDENNYVNIYKCEDKIVLFFPNEIQNNRTLELKIKTDSNIQKNINIPNINENPKEKILKKLILLNSFEQEVLKLIKMPIIDEYDVKEFYLINKNIVQKFRNEYISFNQFANINFNCSYKGYLKCLPKIIQMNQNNLNQLPLNNNQLNNIYKDEKNFVPSFNSIWNGALYPIEFFLLPEELFDLFYTDFGPHNMKKEEFKYNVLIGNDVVFIQDKSNNNIFHFYKINNQNGMLELVCSLNYNEEMTFFNEVNKYIKGRGLENYFKLRNFDTLNYNQYKPLVENNITIGEYIFLKQISFENPKTTEIRNEIRKDLILLNQYNSFIQKIKTLQGTNIEINNINDVLNNFNKFNKMNCLIIDGKNLKFIKDRLYFDKINNLLNFQNSPNYNQEEDKIINIITNEQNQKNINELLNQAFIFNGMKVPENFKGQSVFHFINLDLISQIDNRPEIITKCQNSQAFFFVNNNINCLYYPTTKKLFQINGTLVIDFSIEEKNFDQGLEGMYINLIDLNNDQEKEKDMMKYPIKYMSKPEFYYCINQKWINDFKRYFNYSIIEQFANKYEVWKSYMDKNKVPPNELLNNNNNLIPEQFNYLNLPINIPKNFQLIKKDTFDSILKSINSTYNSNIQINKVYPVSFGGHRVIIKSELNSEIYLIYIEINSIYELDYIIYFYNNNFNLGNLFMNCSRDDTIEEVLSQYYKINLLSKSPQNIMVQNMNLGIFYLVRDKSERKIKEPNHCLGLENIGATCYMNATIQCLCHVLNLKKYFLNKQLVMNDIQNKQCPLTMEFFNVINNLWRESFEGKKYYAPTGFKNIISQMNPLFKGIAANDSKDLIIFLYENIHKEINNPNVQNYQFQNIMNDPDLQEFRNDYYPKNASIMINTFYFEHQNKLICSRCTFTRVSYNIYNILVFPLEKVREYMQQKYPKGFEKVKLEDCFEHYQRGEKLSGSNQIYCNRCGIMTDAENINTIYNSPEVLTIILNRGKGIQFDVYFEYPLELNIDNFVLDKTCKNNHYELICVLTHLGPSGMSGHFVAFCKSPVDGKWYLYNDAQVNNVADPRDRDNTLIEGLPYVLYYQKKKIGPNKITLYIKYYDKQLYIDVEKEITISELIKRLNEKYQIPTNLQISMEFNNNVMLLNPGATIAQYPFIQDKTILYAKVF